MKNIINKVSTVALSITFILGIAGLGLVFAATDPGLGEADTFSIIAQTQITGTGTISGDVGMNSTSDGITALTSADVGGTIYSTNGVPPAEAIIDPQVQADLSSANDDISGQGSDGSIGPALDGLTLTTGVYDIGAGRLNGGVLTLDGPGTYILRASSDLVSSGSINFTNGARACDLYWQVDTLATINGSSFAGTIIAGTGVHFGDGVALDGRALALGGDVTLINNTISGPTCATPPAQPQLIVNKVVVNDDGGAKVISDFSLFLDGSSVTSGVSTTTTVGVHTVSETSDAGYTTVISGDCAADGTITLALGDVKTCTVTNNDIAVSSGGGGGGNNTPTVPPQISVVKVPSPLSLSGGPGTVEYTYTLTNIGEVPVNSVTMVDDSCGSVTFVSGDANTNLRLDQDETWIYTCSTTLSETHTNIVTATGEANGITTTDTATATVVVGVSVVPPLINVTKTPNPLSLSAVGGMVAYTMKVTNPGEVALNNITLNDDKCGPVTYISGDVDNDSRLDRAETWTYTCVDNLTETTVNTVTATGEANGLTARDFAIATVVVRDVVTELVIIPTLPNTGLPPAENNAIWNIVISAGILGALTSFYFIRRKLLS